MDFMLHIIILNFNSFSGDFILDLCECLIFKAISCGLLCDVQEWAARAALAAAG